MAHWIYDLVFYCAFLCILIPVGLLVKQFKHQPPEMRWLMFTLILSFTGDLLAELSHRLKILFVNFGSMFYHIVAPTFFAFFFVNCLRWQQWKMPVISVGFLLSLFSLYNGLYIQKQALNSYSATLLSLFILTISIAYFYKLILELPTNRVQELPLFWIISSFFFTHAGKLVLEIVSYYMTTIMKDNLMVLWTLHNILTIFGLLALTWGVWLQVGRSTIVKAEI
jgi:hypothetical protein